MSRRISISLIVLALSAGFGLGYGWASFNVNGNSEEKKPVVGIEQKREIIKEATPIIYEKEYKLCRHVIIEDFPDKGKLVGKTLQDLRKIYKSENGYSVSLLDGTLTLRQAVEDWCPQDKEKCRLKEYQGRVAVYKGPDTKNDVLVKVTGIKIEILPASIQEKIKNGAYEFENEQVLNDALENLDEFL